MSLARGTKLGPYELLAPLGAGGMGEVYRATDGNLKRQVAIKVLPAPVAGDADRLARFQREAEALAALNHPNIAAIYGLEKTPGLTALVMELVEGEDLSAQIARGPIALPDALPIAKQIAEALEAAHEQGIVHRDLKPQNIKVRADGAVKVLDFGLTKAMDPTGAAGGDAMHSPTLTARATQMGVILGTAAYMAPEQAKGRAVDKRADIWAFGAVVFEMLRGARAFPGDDITDTIVSVVSKEPEWRLLPADLSPTTTVFLKRCLQKDPKQRLGDIHDMRLSLDGAFDTAAPQTTATASPPATHGWRPWAFAVGGAFLAALIIWIAIRPQPIADPAVARLLIGVGPVERLLSGYSGDVSTGQGRPSRTTMAFSPDGRSLVVSAEREGRVQLYLRRLDELSAIPIAGTDGASTPFFSPDGQWLGFYAGGALRRVLVGMWQAPGISPDGRRVAFGGSATGGSDVWTYDVARGALARARMEGSQGIPVWTPDGSRIAVSSSVSGSGNLLLIDPYGRSSAERLTPTLEDGGAPGSWSADGRTLAFTATRRDPQSGTRTRSMWVVSRDGKAEPRQLLSDAAMPDISADGRWLAYASGSPAEVHVQPYPALDHRVQVSINGGTEPVWRRDGRELYYLHNVSAGGALKVRVMAVPVSTTPAFSVGTPRLLFEGPFRIDGGSFRNYDVTADGLSFFMVQEVQRPPARVSQMVLVQNWIEELKQRVKAKR